MSDFDGLRWVILLARMLERILAIGNKSCTTGEAHTEYNQKIVGFSFICFVRSRFILSKLGVKERKNWDFNFYINIASSLIRIKVQIPAVEFFFTFVRWDSKIVAGGGSRK